MHPGRLLNHALSLSKNLSEILNTVFRHDHYRVVLLRNVWLAVEVDEVTRAICLRFKVETIVIVCGDNVRNAINNTDAIEQELFDLAGIVGEETDRPQGQARKHVRRTA